MLKKQLELPSIRHKKHIADVKHRRFDKSALTRHVFDIGHCMIGNTRRFKNLNVIFVNAVFLESYYVNIYCSSMNDKSSNMFPDIYRLLINK